MIDVCGNYGCMLLLNIHLAIVFFGRLIYRTIFYYMIPILRYRRNKQSIPLPLWEMSYYENDTGQDFTYDYIKDLFLEHGYVIIFATAFPLGPLIILLLNSFRLRLDAYKLTNVHKRPVARRTKGIGSWNAILNTLTHIGVFSNAFIISWTSEFVPILMRTFTHYKKLDYVQYTFSAFNVSDFSEEKSFLKEGRQNQTCYYLGKMNAPEHDYEYMPLKLHYHELSIRFVTILLIEVSVLCFASFYNMLVPLVPSKIKKYKAYQRQRKMDLREDKIFEDAETRL